MKPYQNLRHKLVHPKDVAPKMERPNVVYCIPRADCPANYVGETTSKLGKRVDEHRRDVQKAEVEFFALAEHAWKSSHRVDWGRVAICITISDCTNDYSKGSISHKKKAPSFEQGQGHVARSL